MDRVHSDPSNTSNTTFPSAYTIDTPEELAAKARRAARFQTNTPPVNGGGGPVAVGLDDDDLFPDAGLQNRISGLVPGQVGRKKLKGKGGLGYGGAEAAEADPVGVVPLLSDTRT